MSLNSVHIINFLFVYTDTDLTLTTERLVELFASMYDGHVDALGSHLETPPSKSAEFRMNYQDSARRKEAYLDYYAHNNPVASWSTVTEVLRRCRLPQEADVVEKTYVQGMHLQSSLSHDIH